MTTIWDGRIQSDARAIPLADESVQCVVTSPPYFGLRDYGVDGQLGLERTPEAYVASLVEVFREVSRVLRPDGTLWLNLGDSYAGSWGSQGRDQGASPTNMHARQVAAAARKQRNTGSLPKGSILKAKDLIGIPWMVAFALRADGWYLRRDIIWHKPNPMPESVTDRCTSCHEYIFLLTKFERYYYDAEAIKEPAEFRAPNSPQSIKSPHGQGFTKRATTSRNDGATWNENGGRGFRPAEDKQRGHGRRHQGFNERWNGMTKEEQGALGRNKRSVWTIATRPYPEAHYATFPEEIPEICIKAGTKPGDIVLDPFFGSGTVGRVAERLNRRWIGCDLGYQDLLKKRVSNVQKELTEVL